MSIETIVSSVISVIALLMAVLMRSKGQPKTAKTLEQISNEAAEKARKYMTKQCLKNGIKIEEEKKNE